MAPVFFWLSACKIMDLLGVISMPAWKRTALFLLVLICLCATPVLVASMSLSVTDVGSTSFVPDTQARYCLTLIADEELDLSAGTELALGFPAGFQMRMGNYLAANPGVTLASIQFILDGDRYYSVLEGESTVITRVDGTQLVFRIIKGTGTPVPAGHDVFFLVPGIINTNRSGKQEVTLEYTSSKGIKSVTKATMELGAAPDVAPQQIQVTSTESYKIDALWSAVPGANRYQLYYSTHPQGVYIQACDFGHEPKPGETWNLTTTRASYTGDGNGGLSAGHEYYFKVRPGNRFGFGPFSEVVAVKTPVVSVVGTESDPVRLTFDKAVHVVDPDRIALYRSSDAYPIETELVVADETVTIRTGELVSGEEYQLVLYPDAVEGLDEPGVYNTSFVWAFTARR